MLKTRDFVNSLAGYESRVGEAVFFTSRKLSQLYTSAALLATRFTPHGDIYEQEHQLDLSCAICLCTL
eukprot:8236213-Pyramimonas_sp.AAC.1